MLWTFFFPNTNKKKQQIFSFQWQNLSHKVNVMSKSLNTCEPYREFICSRCASWALVPGMNGISHGSAAVSCIYLSTQPLLYVACWGTTLLQSCPCRPCKSWTYCGAHCIVLAVQKMLNGLLVKSVCTALPICKVSDWVSLSMQSSCKNIFLCFLNLLTVTKKEHVPVFWQVFHYNIYATLMYFSFFEMTIYTSEWGPMGTRGSGTAALHGANLDPYCAWLVLSCATLLLANQLTHMMTL